VNEMGWMWKKENGEKGKMCRYGQLHIHQWHHATSRMYMDIPRLKIIISNWTVSQQGRWELALKVNWRTGTWIKWLLFFHLTDQTIWNRYSILLLCGSKQTTECFVCLWFKMFRMSYNPLITQPEDQHTATLTSSMITLSVFSVLSQ